MTTEYDFAKHKAKGFGKEPPIPLSPVARELANMSEDELREGYALLLETVDDLRDEVRELKLAVARRNDLVEGETVLYEEKFENNIRKMVEADGVLTTYRNLEHEYNARRKDEWEIPYPVKWKTVVKVIRNFCEEHSLEIVEIWEI